MGPTALLPLRRKACWGFFFALKIRRLRPGANSRTCVPKAGTLPLDHQSRCAWSYSVTHITLGRTPLYERSAHRRDLYLTTHNTPQQTDFHARGGIRTHNPRKQAAAHQSLRPRGHWHRQISFHWNKKTSNNINMSDLLTHCGREGSFKLFKRPFPGFLTILTL